MADSNQSFIQDAIRKMMASRKTGNAWARGQAVTQPWFEYYPYPESGRGQWKAATSPAEREVGSRDTSSRGSPSLIMERNGGGEERSVFRVITWNIDMLCPLPNARMEAALEYLSTVCETQHAGHPLLILFQEMLTSDLEVIASSLWVRDRFYMTDLTDEYWESRYYGTCTLVDKRLDVKSCFRVHYLQTEMERDVLFVDVVLPSGGKREKTEEVLVRVGNTHLESLVADPPLRPGQVATASSYMHSPIFEGSGALIAGDFNAIQPFDRTLHSEDGLKDAFLESGGQEDTDEAFTWGQQVPVSLRERFGCSRMDKILFCGGERLRVTGFGKVGQGVKVREEADREELRRKGQVEYVTDHLGLWAEIEVQ